MDDLQIGALTGLSVGLVVGWAVTNLIEIIKLEMFEHRKRKERQAATEILDKWLEKQAEAEQERKIHYLKRTEWCE